MAIIDNARALEGRLSVLEERDTPLVQTESGTTRTLTDLDHGSEIYCTNVAGCTVTVPAGFTSTVRVRRATGAGVVTIAKGAGVTIESTGGDVNPTLLEGGAAVVGAMSPTMVSIDGALV